MNVSIRQRFTLLVKGSVSRLFDAIEDPEQSLHQLILDMEDELEIAKRAAARAIANEDRLCAQIDRAERDAADYEAGARRSLARDKEDDAREALRRAEQTRQQAARLAERLRVQKEDGARVRSQLGRMQRQLIDARSRLELLQARLRQGEARKAIGRAMRGVAHSDLQAEFDRLGDRVERLAAEDDAYLGLDAELRGDDLRRRVEEEAIDDAVEDQLSRMRTTLEGVEDPGDPVDTARAAPEPAS